MAQCGIRRLTKSAACFSRALKLSFLRRLASHEQLRSTAFGNRRPFCQAVIYRSRSGPGNRARNRTRRPRRRYICYRIVISGRRCSRVLDIARQKKRDFRTAVESLTHSAFSRKRVSDLRKSTRNCIGLFRPQRHCSETGNEFSSHTRTVFSLRRTPKKRAY